MTREWVINNYSGYKGLVLQNCNPHIAGPGEIRLRIEAFALNWGRSELYQRINKRTLCMLNSGWLAEVEELLNSYSPELRPMQSIGYREVVQYLQNRLKWDEMVYEIQKRTRHFAKRQLTWFRREPKIVWYHPFEQNRILNDIKVYLENLMHSTGK